MQKECRIPSECTILDHLNDVKKLMNPWGNSWNMKLIDNPVLMNTTKMIKKINILEDPEQGALFWIPSKSRKFSIRSSYRENEKEQFNLNSNISRARWKTLWKTRLHGTHKILIKNSLGYYA